MALSSLMQPFRRTLISAVRNWRFSSPRAHDDEVTSDSWSLGCLSRRRSNRDHRDLKLITIVNPSLHPNRDRSRNLVSLLQWSFLRTILGRLFGLGIRPEHVQTPEEMRRLRISFSTLVSWLEIHLSHTEPQLIRRSKAVRDAADRGSVAIGKAHA
jgi:hypothetical protein